MDLLLPAGSWRLLTSTMETSGHCPNPEMKEMTESVMVLACNTEGTLASESRGSSSGPRSLSLSHLPKFCTNPFSSLDCFYLYAKKERGLTWINFTISSNSRISATSTVPRTSTINIVQFSSVQSLSHVWLFATAWTAAHQASLSITNS